MSELPQPPGPPRPGLWTDWSRPRILALAALLLVGDFLVQVAVYGLTGDMSWPVLTGAVVGVGLPLALLHRARRVELARDLAWRRPTRRQAVLAVLLTLAAVPPTSLLAEISLRMHPPDAEWLRLVNEQLPRGPLELALAALAVVVAGPLAEEIVFRALLHRLAARTWGAVPATAVSALVFGIAHAEPWFVLGLIGVGVVMAVVWEATRSLPAVWLAHAVHNALSLTMMTRLGAVTGELAPLAAVDLLLAGGGLVLSLLLGRELLRARRA